MTNAEVYFCRMNKNRFAGKCLCRRCREFVPKAEARAPEPSAAPAPVRTASEAEGPSVGKCASCGCSVDAKVVSRQKATKRTREKGIGSAFLQGPSGHLF
jgi:hypothetical protein